MSCCLPLSCPCKKIDGHPCRFACIISLSPLETSQGYSPCSPEASFWGQAPVLRGAPEAGEDQLADEQQLLRQPVIQLHEQLLVREQLLLPGAAINRHQLVELLAREALHPAPVQVFVTRHPADRALDADRAAMCALDNPLQDAHILA